MAEGSLVYRVGAFEIRPRERKLLRAGREMPVGSRGFEILLALVDAGGELVSKDALLARVWPGVVVEEGNLHTQVSALRKALGADGAAIVTVPGRGYRFAGAIERLDVLKPPIQATLVASPDRPSIAVLPFQNLSGDPEQGYFADGMAEELITALSRMRWLSVVGRNASFAQRDRQADLAGVAASLGVRYVVGGSVRRALNRMRVACHLTDTATGNEIWSDRFDGDASDVFDLQDRVTASIIGALEPQLRGAEVSRARAKPTGDLVAYDHYLRALGLLSPRTPANYEQALAELDAALGLDGDFALALALSAHCHYVRLAHGWAPATAAQLATMVDLAEAALARGRDDPGVLTRVAFVLGWCGQGLSAALQIAERANRLNPSSSYGMFVEGWLRLQAGHPDDAIARFAAAIALSPLDALSTAAATAATAQAHLFARRDEEAARWAERAVREAPDLDYAHRVLVAALALSGREREAAAAVRGLRALEPGFTVESYLANLPIRDNVATQRLVEGLRLALDEPSG